MLSQLPDSAGTRSESPARDSPCSMVAQGLACYKPMPHSSASKNGGGGELLPNRYLPRPMTCARPTVADFAPVARSIRTPTPRRNASFRAQRATGCFSITLGRVSNHRVAHILPGSLRSVVSIHQSVPPAIASRCSFPFVRLPSDCACRARRTSRATILLVR